MLTLYNALLHLLANLLPFLRRIWPKLQSDLLAPRESLLERWQQKANLENALWFHVSSVGELEQVRPVMDALKKSGHPIYLTYFSNSVPKLVKDWSFVDRADYLPLDFPSEMEKLVKILRPKLLVFNRYDLWPNLMQQARQMGIPLVVVNASIPPQGLFGRLSLWIRRPLFFWVDGWTFVDTNAAEQWEPVVYRKVKGLVTGDPRVDRALERVEAAMQEGKARGRLNHWRRKKFCVVAGSTWPQDEKVLLEAWRQLPMEKSLVVVPHEPEPEYLRALEARLRASGLSSVRWTELGEGQPAEADVLLVDQRGFLAEIYSVGTAAYVGGGFGRQIHSVVEPAAHGLSVAFGPHFQRSPEALNLVAAGGASSIRKARDLVQWWSTLEGQRKEQKEEAIRIFLQIHKGAGQRVAEFLEEGLRENRFRRKESWDRVDLEHQTS
jgi:3-deoxy-D-manno-octulosonic-acid transferase